MKFNRCRVVVNIHLLYKCLEGISVCRYRLNEEAAQWIIYVTDVGQSQHFDMFFKVGAW
jgi:uncharacterized protein YmfQ (DUF2313 family)